MKSLLEIIIVPILVGVLAAGTTIYVNETQRQEAQNVETTLRILLSRPEWKYRSFEAISSYFGDAYTKQELQRHLLAAGALQFTGEDGETKWWGLASRNEDRIQ